MIAITGATGQLGQFVVKQLAAEYPTDQTVLIVRNKQKAMDLFGDNYVIREAEYNDKPALTEALNGVEKLLLISSSEVGQRKVQHENVVDAAIASKVSFIAYTSLLHADTSELGLAVEHLSTEAYLKTSGIKYALLRNGWYSENYLASVPAAIEHGALIGAAKDGKIASAAREDYAAAAVKVLLAEQIEAAKVYELAGDESYTLSELAALISEKAGKEIPYVNMSAEEYKGALEQAGLPTPIADLLANSDAGAAKGGLYDNSKTLSTLIGKPTTAIKSML